MKKCCGEGCKLKNDCYFFISIPSDKGSFKAPFIILENGECKCDKYKSIDKGVKIRIMKYNKYKTEEDE